MLCFYVVFVLDTSNRQLLLFHQRGCRGEHPVQICVVGLYRHGGGLIPSTTAVPSAGSSGEHPVQMCVVGLNRHDGAPIT